MHVSKVSFKSFLVCYPIVISISLSFLQYRVKAKQIKYRPMSRFLQLFTPRISSPHAEQTPQ